MKQKKSSLIDQLCNECDDLRYVLEKEGADDADTRYKKIVLSVLPILLVRIGTIGTLLCVILGAFFGHLLGLAF